MTGLGEHAHLLSERITLGTHMLNVAGLITAKELSNVVLVGCSYSSMLVTGVADHIPDRIHHIVNLDALIPENGDTASAFNPSNLVNNHRTATREQGRGLTLPVPGPDAFPTPDDPAKGRLMRRLRLPSIAPTTAQSTLPGQ